MSGRRAWWIGGAAGLAAAAGAVGYWSRAGTDLAAPAGDAAYWTRAADDVPPLPADALPACSDGPRETAEWAGRETLGILPLQDHPFVGFAAAAKKGPVLAPVFLGSEGNWDPVDGARHVLCGELDAWTLFSGIDIGNREYDLHPHIIPAPGFEYLIDDARPLVDAVKGEVDACGDPARACLFGEVTPPVVFQRWFYGEPTFPDDAGGIPRWLAGRTSRDHREHDVLRKAYITNRYVGDTVCGYGPWVVERAHGNRPEIHPLEMLWAYDEPTGDLHVLVTRDASDRFQKRHYYNGRSGLDDDLAWQDGAASAFRVAFRTEPGASARIAVRPLLGPEPELPPQTTTELPLPGGGSLSVSHPEGLTAGAGSFCRGSDGRVYGFADLALGTAHAGFSAWAVGAQEDDWPHRSIDPDPPGPGESADAIPDCHAGACSATVDFQSFLSSEEAHATPAPEDPAFTARAGDVPPDPAELGEPVLYAGKVRSTGALARIVGEPPGMRALWMLGAATVDAWFYAPGQELTLIADYQGADASRPPAEGSLALALSFEALRHRDGDWRVLPVEFGGTALPDKVAVEFRCGSLVSGVTLRAQGAEDERACDGPGSERGAGVLVVRFPPFPEGSTSPAGRSVQVRVSGDVGSGEAGAVPGSYSRNILSIAPGRDVGQAPDDFGWPGDLYAILGGKVPGLERLRLQREWDLGGGPGDVFPARARRARILRSAGRVAFSDAALEPGELELLAALARSYVGTEE